MRRARERTRPGREIAPRYDHALQTLQELPYDRWRTPDAEGTDFRSFDELRRELEG